MEYIMYVSCDSEQEWRTLCAMMNHYGGYFDDVSKLCEWPSMLKINKKDKIVSSGYTLGESKHIPDLRLDDLRPLEPQAKEMPRRCCIERLTAAESSILDAILKVEEMGAHAMLTSVVNLLGHAKNCLSDYIDSRHE